MALDRRGDRADVLGLIGRARDPELVDIDVEQARLPMRKQRPIQMRAPTRRAIIAAIGMLLAGWPKNGTSMPLAS